MDITEELRTFVVDNFLFGQANGSLPDDTSFLDSGIVDSTGLLELIAFIEQTYAIRLTDDELIPENLDSLARLTQFIDSKLAQARPKAYA